MFGVVGSGAKSIIATAKRSARRILSSRLTVVDSMMEERNLDRQDRRTAARTGSTLPPEDRRDAAEKLARRWRRSRRQ